MNATTDLSVCTAKLAGMFTHKLTADDILALDESMRGALVDFAEDFVKQYTGTFTFILNVRNNLQWGMSDAQVAGVVNCAISDYNYSQKRAAVQQAEQIMNSTTTRTYDHSKQYVADGWYTIVGPKGGHRTLRLETVESNDKYTSDGVKQWLAYLCGPDNSGDYKTVGFVHGNEVVLLRKYTNQYTDIVAAARFLISKRDNIGEYGRQYAIRSGRCYVCNRKLTTPESVAAGIGPVCASR